MPRRKLLITLIAGAVLGATGVLVHDEIAAQTPPATSRNAPKPAKGWSEQQRAQQKSEEDTITSDCAALRKMGIVDKDCPPAKGAK